MSQARILVEQPSTYGYVELDEPLEEVISYRDSVSGDRTLVLDLEGLKFMAKVFDLCMKTSDRLSGHSSV